MRQVAEILEKWGFYGATVLQQFDVAGGRLVYKVQAGEQMLILKGQPADVSEEKLRALVRAHKYLGNEKHMAPLLYETPGGGSYIKDGGYYYYVMEAVSGRNVLETPEEEYLLGQAAARLHNLTNYDYPCTLSVKKQIHTIKGWFADRAWKAEYDAIVTRLPDFDAYRQCFIHTDIGPYNAMRDDSGRIVFIDLDDSGTGSQYIDLGWPFISQFVAYDKQTRQMGYKLEIAKAYLEGYCSVRPLTREEYNLLWSGAALSHIYSMQWHGPEAAEPLWNILRFGLAQKDRLLDCLNCIS